MSSLIKYLDIKAMSKFKVGDKVKCINNIDAYVSCGGVAIGVVCDTSADNKIRIARCSRWWHQSDFEPADEWSIYNNDKPLSELSDEQAAELFNYYRNGGKVEVMSDSGEWCDAISFVGFGAEMSYRAKQKSERELFIDAARLAGGSMQYTLDERELIVAMFDAGFKAPKVGERWLK